MPEAPRFQYPLRLHAGGATVVEQDTIDDIVSTAYYAVRTPLGFRAEAPGFGVTDPTFGLNPMPQLVRELERSDPRVAILATEERDDLTLKIQLLVSGQSA